MLGNLKTKSRVLIGSAIPLALLVALAGVAIWAIGSINQTGRWVTHTYEVLIKADGIIASAVDMETGMRGYLLAGKEDFLAPYKGGQEQVYARIADLQETVSDNPTQVTRLAEVEKTLREWQANVTEPAIELRREIGDSKTMDDVARLVGEARGKVYFDKFRSLMTEFKSEEEALMRSRQEDAVSTTDTVNTFLWGGGVVAVTIGLILAWVIGNGIAGPIEKMTGAMGRLAEGDLDSEIPGTGRKDEIGDMAIAVQIFKDNAIEVKRIQAEQAERDRRAGEEKRAEMIRLADSFEQAVSGVVDSVSSAAAEMQSSSESMSGTAEQTSQQATAVAAAAEQATGNVQTVAIAAEELSSSIREINQQVGQASQIAGKAASAAEQTTGTVQGLAEAVQKIGSVVNLINDIAEQTNLLALNATIEAARAGDAGKGFAVVASEVKSLASQTGNATQEIAAQVASVQSETQQAVAAISQIRSVIEEINEISAGIASAMEEQGAATQEIARNVDQAKSGTEDVSSNISRVSAGTQETGSAASEVRSAAGELAQQSNLLRREVDKFIAEIRAR